MRELTVSEVEVVSGGSVPQCHAGDPPPYSQPHYGYADYLKLYLMLR